MKRITRGSRPAEGIMMVWVARPVGFCSVWNEITYYYSDALLKLHNKIYCKGTHTHFHKRGTRGSFQSSCNVQSFDQCVNLHMWLWLTSGQLPCPAARLFEMACCWKNCLKVTLFCLAVAFLWIPCHKRDGIVSQVSCCHHIWSLVSSKGEYVADSLILLDKHSLNNPISLTLARFDQSEEETWQDQQKDQYMILAMVHSCINTIVVILSDWCDTDAGLGENL